MATEFESANLAAFKLLHRIEVGLREWARLKLEAHHGAAWQRRLPGALLTKIRTSQTEELRPNFDFIRLGPLYYLTFGELVELLKQAPLKSHLDELGGQQYVAALSVLLGPRNAVCHCRPVSSIGRHAVEIAYAQLACSIGEVELLMLTENPQVGVFPDEVLSAFRDFLEPVPASLAKLPPVFEIPEIYDTAVNQFWWGDRELAGFNSAELDVLVEMLTRYNEISTGVGSAARRQRFIEKNCLVEKIEACLRGLQ